MSKLDLALRATERTSNGSNLAASSSFAIIRATFVPSDEEGGARAPPWKAWPTASFILFDVRDK
jgi:hypothetical protein